MYFPLTWGWKLALGLVAWLLLIAGCAESDLDVESPQGAAAQAVAPAVAAPAAPTPEPPVNDSSQSKRRKTKRDSSSQDTPQKTAGGDEDSTTSPPTSENTPETQQTAYTPPFPERLDMFAVPKNKRSKQGSRAGSGDTVELIGFVHVDRPRAVLSIDGEVAPIAEGDRQAGVEVISIQPPVVVLQRGRERWQASLLTN
jgi:hypothetical protein